MKAAVIKIAKIMLIIVLAVGLYVGIVLAQGTMTDFQPTGIQSAKCVNSTGASLINDSSLTFLIWNLGYGGLGEACNFFFDNGNIFFSGGKMVRPAERIVQQNLAGIAATLSRHPADFVLLQEVDFHSKRSYFINQFEMAAAAIEQNSACFAPNYKSDRVPIPIFEPWQAYGEVLSGLASYSTYIPVGSQRVQLPGEFEWPTRIFQLDRCALVQRFKTGFENELVVINIHNSAYDKSGKMKKQQMAFLKDMFLEEYQKGNFVVVGGDWNQCPPGFPFDTFRPENTQGYTQINIAEDFMPAGWSWVYDNSTPTNRKIRDVYKRDSTFITLIDFYLLSPNIEVVDIGTIDLDFKYSDHQPVRLSVHLGRVPK